MTNEEIIARLRKIADHAVHAPGEMPFVMSLDDGIAVHEAIKMLSQQTDAISRQSVLNMQYRINDSVTLSMGGVVNVKNIEDLPPVTSKPRMGHWIYIGNKVINHSIKIVECDECHNRTYGSTNYCPKCGIKMEVEEKRCSNCKFWRLDINDENRRCKYCYRQDEWQAESEDKE